MKKILTLSLLLVSGAIFASSAEAKTSAGATASANAAPQIYQSSRYNRRGVRIVNRTRIVRRGSATYRETYQIRYRPNGTTTTRLVSRVRIR